MRIMHHLCWALATIAVLGARLLLRLPNSLIGPVLERVASVWNPEGYFEDIARIFTASGPESVMIRRMIGEGDRQMLTALVAGYLKNRLGGWLRLERELAE